MATAVFGAAWRFFPARRRQIALPLGLLLLLGGTFFILRPQPNRATTGQITAALQGENGGPVLVALFSDYWTACLRAEPIVDGLAAEWGDSVQVLRLDVHDAAAQATLRQLAFRFTPTFILLDDAGAEVWRAVGGIDPDAARQEAAQLLAAEGQ